MRPRTPSFIWIPFVFSIGTISWALLIGSLGVLGAVVVAPAVQEVKDAEARRNNVQYTLALYDHLINNQGELIKQASSNVEVIQRLASLRLGIEKLGQETLVLHPGRAARDTSVQSLIADSLPEGRPAPVEPMPWYLQPATHGPTRTLLVMVACVGLVLSFVLGVRYDARGR